MALTEEEIKELHVRFEDYNHMCDLYNEDKRFKRFVDAGCEAYGYHKDIYLLNKTVQEVGKYYEENPEDTNVPPKNFKKDFEEDKAC